MSCRVLLGSPSRDHRRHHLLVGPAFLGRHRRQTRDHAFPGTALTVTAARLTMESCGSCRFSHRWPLAVGGVRCSYRGRHRHFLVIGALQVRGGVCLGSTLGHPGAGHQSVESGVAGQDASAPAAWFGASFAGMTSMERLAGRYWMLPLLGLIFGVLFAGSGPRVHGFGGLLEIPALVR